MSRLPQAIVLAREPPDSAVQDSNAIAPLWIGFSVALFVVAAASVEARIRLRDGDDVGLPRRLPRIVLAAAALAGGVTLLLLVEMVVRPDPDDEMLLMTLVALAVCMTISLIVVAVLDFWLGWLGPRRSRKWLALAVLAFVLLVSGALGLAMWLGGGFDEPPEPDLLELPVVAAAAGITWWSRLPPPTKGIERRFE